MNTVQSIKYIDTHFNNILNNKVKAFEQSVIKNYNFEKTYEPKKTLYYANIL